MSEAASPRKFAFWHVVSASYVLAAAIIALVFATWGSLWIVIAAFVGWLAFEIWAFREFGMRAAWTLLAVLLINPATALYFILHYACAVNGQCL